MLLQGAEGETWVAAVGGAAAGVVAALGIFVMLDSPVHVGVAMAAEAAAVEAAAVDARLGCLRVGFVTPFGLLPLGEEVLVDFEMRTLMRGWGCPGWYSTREEDCSIESGRPMGSTGTFRLE